MDVPHRVKQSRRQLVPVEDLATLIAVNAFVPIRAVEPKPEIPVAGFSDAERLEVPR
jgi:hypothetical protein